MTIAQLENSAIEKSSFVIRCTVRDANQALVTPTSMVWTLSDTKGRIINEKEDVPVVDPSSVEDILLYGEDLALEQRNNRMRIFTMLATWSGSYGESIPVRKAVRFEIKDLLKVS